MSGSGHGRPVTIAERPTPGVPRPYAFPPFDRVQLANGLSVVTVHLPNRPMIAGTLVVTGGATGDPELDAGATVLMAHALTEGTEKHDAVGLVEATERLGASLHVEAGWDALSVTMDVAAARFPALLSLAAEVMAEPTFPATEIDRLRDERLNDLLQAAADPRRLADQTFTDTIYAATSPYRRSAAGLRETVEGLDESRVRQARARLFDPARMTLIVGGDLTGLDIPALAAERFEGWRADPAAQAVRHADDSPASRSRRIRVMHRPGSVQTEIRVGHPGLPRLIPDFHAVSVMSALLGGLFGSRLNRKLREEKGYTYGAGAGFDFRRAAGPFSARAAVNTDVTVPALVDLLAELDGIRGEPVSDVELATARDYLVGVFPLRFETPGAVVGAISGLVIQGLPDDELTRYRAAIEAVTSEAVFDAARAHVRPDEAAIVLIGDADAFVPALEVAAIGPITVERVTVEPDPDRGPEAPDHGSD
ncbi:MAG: pitrilysin family protein [Candidatus Limnocylindrales bacterium]